MGTLRNILLCVFLCPYVAPKSSHRQLTVSVTAGTEECFFLSDIKIGQVIEIDYQVTSSSAATGNNDIIARVYSPKAEVLFESEQETEGSFNTGSEEDGDFKLCFDNKVSTWSDKVIWFETEVTDPEDDYWDDDYMMDEEDWEEARQNNEDSRGPAGPIGPGLPSSPFSPGPPKSPLAPSKPGNPRCPFGPGIPGIPARPRFPGGPGGPAGPASPSVPASPSFPVKPGRPRMPCDPGGPGGPGSPWSPCGPINP